MSFKLKYLGNTVVDKSVGENVSRDAIKNIIKVAKASGKKIARVNVEISLKGISVADSKGNLMFEISIYRISNCSTDKSHRQVFSFFSTDENETMECHAFLCPKRKVAEVMALTVAHAFTNAYEHWKTSPGAVQNGANVKGEEMKNTLNTMKTQIIENDLMTDDCAKSDADEIIEEKLIDFDTELIPNVDISKNDWVGFDDDFGRTFDDFETDFDNGFLDNILKKAQQNNAFCEMTNKYDVFRTSLPNNANQMDFAAF
ncbi:low density lipoprotein receptor adapter protein 1-B-like isoform X2 [Photinus pyralis]|nr:low density lipoprotein receptor adapter protein 1-B-like isoform X2 [Photinus pyralis]